MRKQYTIAVTLDEDDRIGKESRVIVLEANDLKLIFGCHIRQIDGLDLREGFFRNGRNRCLV